MKTQERTTQLCLRRRLSDGAELRNNGENQRIATNRSPSAASAQQALHKFCLLTLIIFVTVLKSQAQCSVSWASSSFRYDNGFNPKVALSGSTVVEVHNGGNGIVPLWYRVGQLGDPTIQWGNSLEYDAHGNNPSVALSGSTVVEVHNGADGAGPLWYRVGLANPSSKTIQWGNRFEYEASGFNPSVALSGSTVIEVHNAGAEVGPLWYRIGLVNLSSKTIQWGNNFEYDANGGFNPSVAVSGSTVVEVHNGGNGGIVPLWYRLGQLNGSTIQWSGSFQYDNGFNPTVGYDGHRLVEVHNGGFGGLFPLWYHLGHINGTRINWDSYNPGEYDYGMNPSVAVGYADGFERVVDVHDGADGVGPLWYRTAYIECIQ